jgi:hypothetical protein
MSTKVKLGARIRVDKLCRSRGIVLNVGYISCDSVKRNNNNKKSVTVNKQ